MYTSDVMAAQSADCGSRVSGPPLKSRRNWLVTLARSDWTSCAEVPPPAMKVVLTNDQLVVATTVLSSSGKRATVCSSARVPVACA